MEISQRSESANGDRNSLAVDPSRRVFIDTSTWDQIIRVLEESSTDANPQPSGEYQIIAVSESVYDGKTEQSRSGRMKTVA
jgi:hypothetical protein